MVSVAVIGAGRLGAVVARRLPKGSCRIIMCRHPERIEALALEVNAGATSDPAAVKGCKVILMVIPPQSVIPVLKQLQPHIDRDALVVNMATQLPTGQIKDQFPSLRVAAAKMVGHADDIAEGLKGVLVLNHVNASEKDLLTQLLAEVGQPIEADDDIVNEVNTAVAEEMIEALERVRRRLTALEVADSIQVAAAASLGPTMMRTLAKGEPGPFLQSIVKRRQ